jgi:hypothetical protein
MINQEKTTYLDMLRYLITKGDERQTRTRTKTSNAKL